MLKRYSEESTDLRVMVGTVERIERDIAAIEQAVEAIAQEFYETYSQYLDDLGASIRQQLVLASYHLCTQGYPERFLRLSFSQRQEFQQALRELTQQAQNQLKEQLYRPGTKNRFSLATLLRAVSKATETEESELESSSDLDLQISEAHLEDADSEFGPEQPDSPEDFFVASLLSQDELAAKLTEELAAVEMSEESLQNLHSVQPAEHQEDHEESDASAQSLSPARLAQWQESIDASIVELLQILSHASNRLLQKFDILPQKLPEPVLEVAAKADLVAESAVGPPNLLKLMVETEPDEEGAEPSIAQIMAIHLRLSEIEFHASTVTAWRSKLRDLSNRLTHLGREYQKKQRDKAIAEAEAAWRSSWFDE